jgi:cytidine deaminase
MDSLIQIAQKSLKNAYNPYSGLSIGCALRTKDGKIYEGANIENSVFGLTMCAERVAVFKAISEGNHEINEIAIVSSTGKPAYPCGACRQVLSEFNSKMKIYVSDNIVLNLTDLLPYAFSNESLK